MVRWPLSKTLRLTLAVWTHLNALQSRFTHTLLVAIEITTSRPEEDLRKGRWRFTSSGNWNWKINMKWKIILRLRWGGIWDPNVIKDGICQRWCVLKGVCLLQEREFTLLDVLFTLFQAYLHSMSIIHRDLNSHNCLVKLVSNMMPYRMSHVVKSEQMGLVDGNN